MSAFQEHMLIYGQDHAAGSLIITEAGGKVSDAYGAPLDFGLGRTLKKNKGIVAASSGIFDEVIKAVGAEWKP